MVKTPILKRRVNFYRALPKKVREPVIEYIEILKKDKLPIDGAIVFGSQAKRSAHKDSDIDLCIISSKFKDPFKAMHYLMMKSYQVNASIEPHPYSPKYFVSEDPLVWEIKKIGIEVPLQ